jgi:hypothetical protein
MAAAKKAKLQSDSFRERFIDAFPILTSFIRENLSSAHVGDAVKHFLEVCSITGLRYDWAIGISE